MFLCINSSIPRQASGLWQPGKFSLVEFDFSKTQKYEL